MTAPPNDSCAKVFRDFKADLQECRQFVVGLGATDDSLIKEHIQGLTIRLRNAKDKLKRFRGDFKYGQ